LKKRDKRVGVEDKLGILILWMMKEMNCKWVGEKR